MWLRGKLSAVIAACVVAPLALTVGAIWFAGADTLQDQAKHDLKAATQSIAAAIEGELERDLAELKTFGALPVMQDALIGDSGRDIARAIGELKAQSPEMLDLFATDAHGVVIASTSPADVGRLAKDDDGFRTAISGSAFQDALTIRDTTGTAAISFTVPLIATYDRQSVIGTLTGVIDLALVAKGAKARSTLSSSDDALLLIRRSDRRIGFATHSDGIVADVAKSAEPVLSWRGRSHFVSSASSMGKQLVLDPGFDLIAVAPLGAAAGAIDKILLIAGLAAFAGAAAVLAWAWRWSSPLVALGTAMGRLARGDVAARAPEVAATHTFGPMTRAFESLRQAKSVQEWLAGRERELVRKKELAEQALHDKSEHLASLTRALKEQLTTIVSLSEAINAEALNAVTGSSRASLAKDISRSGTQLLTVINDLFELSEAEAGHTSLRESDADLCALVHDSVAVMHEAADKASVALACTCPTSDMTARVDVQKIKQVMFNLLSNAIKFTPAGGRVEVTLKIDANGRPAIVVADTGIGMPANLSPMAASPFAGGEANVQGRHGAGLGLPLVRRFVDMHDGVVEIESEAGKGTTVTVALPARRLVEAAPAVVRLAG